MSNEQEEGIQREQASTRHGRSGCITKDNLLIGVLIVAAVVSISLFIVTLVMVTQIKDYMSTEKQDKEIGKLNQAVQKLSLHLEDEIKNINDKVAQMLNETVTRLTENMEQSFNRTKVEVEKFLTANWYKASDGLFYKKFPMDKNYEDAKDRCEIEYGRLLSKGLRDPSVLGELRQSVLGSGSFWIGYNDIEKEGDWVWLDGGKTNPNTTEWKSGNPDNHNEEDCGQVAEFTEEKALLNDARCHLANPFVCEKTFPSLF